MVRIEDATSASGHCSSQETSGLAPSQRPSFWAEHMAGEAMQMTELLALSPVRVLAATAKVNFDDSRRE
jgi:hypothetical protein